MESNKKVAKTEKKSQGSTANLAKVSNSDFITLSNKLIKNSTSTYTITKLPTSNQNHTHYIYKIEK